MVDKLPADHEKIQNSTVNSIKALFTPNRVLLIFIFFGIALRVLTIWTVAISGKSGDGVLYAMIGHGLVKDHSFVEPLNNEPTWQYSLTYPAWLACFYAIFGFSILTTKIAATSLSILTLFVVYFFTRDLYGHRKALFVTAIISLCEQLITSTGINTTENILILFFVPMVWSMIKALDNDRYYIFFGLFGGLTYISKTNLGFSIVLIAIFTLFIWRFYYVRHSILRNFFYLLGNSILLIFVFIREFFIRTSDIHLSVTQTSISYLLTRDGLINLIIQTPIHIILPAIFCVFLFPELRHAIKNRMREHYNWLSLVIIGVFTYVLLYAASCKINFALIRTTTDRYFTLAYVPVMWLLVRKVDLSSKGSDIKSFLFVAMKKIKNFKFICIIFGGMLLAAVITVLLHFTYGLIIFIGVFALTIPEDPRKRLSLMLIAFLITAPIALDSSHPREFIEAMDDAENYIESGDALAVDYYSNAPLRRDSAYLYLNKLNIEIINYYEGCNATYLLSQTLTNTSYDDYDLIKIYEDPDQLDIRAKIYWELKRLFLGTNSGDPKPRPPIKLWELNNST